MVLISIFIHYSIPLPISFLTPSLSTGTSRITTIPDDDSVHQLMKPLRSSTRRSWFRSGSLPDVSIDRRSSPHFRLHRNKSSSRTTNTDFHSRGRSASPHHSKNGTEHGLLEAGTSMERITKKQMLQSNNCELHEPCSCSYPRNTYAQSDSVFDRQLLSFTGRDITVIAFACAVAAILVYLAAPAYYTDR